MNTIKSALVARIRAQSGAFAALVFLSGLASAHVAECSRFDGVDQLRCERHLKMAEKCGLLKGPAHHVCDREFLLANPLVCTALKPEQKPACEAEIKAFKACEPRPGLEFITCVKQTTGASPVGH